MHIHLDVQRDGRNQDIPRTYLLEALNFGAISLWEGDYAKMIHRVFLGAALVNLPKRCYPYSFSRHVSLLWTMVLDKADKKLAPSSALHFKKDSKVATSHCNMLCSSH